jgi:hypothetical protein
MSSFFYNPNFRKPEQPKSLAQKILDGRFATREEAIALYHSEAITATIHGKKGRNSVLSFHLVKVNDHYQYLNCGEV